MERVLVLLVVLVATGAFSTWWKARDGRVVSRTDRSGRWDGLPVEAADVAAVVRSSTPLTLVEFTAPDCQPCLVTRDLLHAAVEGRADVSVAAIDVADALDLARAHRIMRAPTTLFITDEGHLLGRVSGIPRRDELDALLDSTREPVRVA